MHLPGIAGILGVPAAALGQVGDLPAGPGQQRDRVVLLAERVPPFLLGPVQQRGRPAGGQEPDHDHHDERRGLARALAGPPLERVLDLQPQLRGQAVHEDALMDGDRVVIEIPGGEAARYLETAVDFPRVPAVRQRPRPDGGVIAWDHDSRPGTPEAVGLDSHPGFGLQVADVVRLRPMRGDQPEGIAVQPVSHRGMPRQPGTEAGRLQQRERAGRQARAHGNADQPVAGPLQRGDHTVLPRAHLLVVPRAPWPRECGNRHVRPDHDACPAPWQRAARIAAVMHRSALSAGAVRSLPDPGVLSRCGDLRMAGPSQEPAQASRHAVSSTSTSFPRRMRRSTRRRWVRGRR